MKKVIIILVILSISIGGYYYFSIPHPKDFVSLSEDNTFKLNNEDFYPVAINYCVSLQSDGNSYWARPHGMYNVNNSIDVSTKQACLKQFKEDMELIKKMGFNAIRICKVGEELVDKKNNDELTMLYQNSDDKTGTFILSGNEKNYGLYFNALDEMFGIIDQAGLKVIFLLRMVPYSESTKNHLKKIVSHNKNNTTIMAYDLYNEPLYFDTLERTKTSVFYEVNTWDEIVNVSSKHHHLTTIGLEGIRETFEWDPNLLNVDFITFHPYEYEPKQVMNEIYWYGKHVTKTWMIGETAIPSDNDSITYDEQKQFAAQTLQQTINCGGIGYTWWQFKDIMGMKYHDSYMGMVDMEGNVKPIAEAFQAFTPTVTDTGIAFDNYYNYSECDSFYLKGKVINQNNEPIDGAVILGWNESWNHSYHTLTKPDGTFKLKGCYTFYHWIMSALEHTTIRDSVRPDSLTVYPDDGGIPYVDLGVLQVEKLNLK